METAIVVFTRDLRLHDNPALHQACTRARRIPAASQDASPALAKGGETEGRRRFAAFRQNHLAGYPEHHDDLAGDQTSRLSAYLRFGCVSPLEVASGASYPDPLVELS